MQRSILGGSLSRNSSRERGPSFSLSCIYGIEYGTAGIVAHSSQWPFCGYNEIQKPRKKNVLINYDKLMELFGASSYEQTRLYHKEWINDYLDKGNGRDNKWTKSIAVGSNTLC